MSDKKAKNLSVRSRATGSSTVRSSEDHARGIRKERNLIPGHQADPHRASELDWFRFAVVDVFAKHKCCSCSTPIRRRGIRRVVICPVCNTANELKK